MGSLSRTLLLCFLLVVPNAVSKTCSTECGSSCFRNSGCKTYCQSSCLTKTTQHRYRNLNCKRASSLLYFHEIDTNEDSLVTIEELITKVQSLNDTICGKVFRVDGMSGVRGVNKQDFEKALGIN